MNRRSKIEKEVWEIYRPFLDLPPTHINTVQNNEGMRQYMNARRIISESIKDPVFVKKVQEHKATITELLMKDFDAETFQRLFNTDIRACVPDEKKKKGWL